MAPTTAGLIGMLNNAGVRNARVEYFALPHPGWYINGFYAGETARASREMVRENPERFLPTGGIVRRTERAPTLARRWVLLRVK